jgi:nucleoid-associated protein YgaU
MGFLGRLFGGEKKSAAEVPVLTYRVGINETCRTLAQRFYGSEAQWERIFAANERVIKEEVQTSTSPLLPGTEIIIPDPAFGLDGQPHQPGTPSAA